MQKAFLETHNVCINRKISENDTYKLKSIVSEIFR